VSTTPPDDRPIAPVPIAPVPIAPVPVAPVPTFAPPPNFAIVAPGGFAPAYVPRAGRPPVEPPPGVRWGLPDAAIVLGLAVVALALGVLYLFLRLPATFNVFELVFAVATYGAIFAAVVIISRRRGLRSLAADFGVAFRPVDLAIGLGIAILAKIFVGVSAAVAYAITGSVPRSGNVSFGHDPLWIVINGFLVASLLAPFVEEVMFRGVLLRAVRYAILRGPRSRPRPQPAPEAVRARAVAISLLVSAVLFSAFHVHETFTDPPLLIGLGLGFVGVGLLHGWVTIATGRLGAAIVSHVLFNGSATLLVLLDATH
jgi:membrane protease YdiL (CAAX protease family)